MSITYHHEQIEQDRPVWQSILRGLNRKCPACGEGPALFNYVKVRDHCPACGEALHHHRADDAPAYMTIFIVGHLIVAIAGTVEAMYHPALWIHMAVWIPLTILLSLALLPMMKGALIGLQWAKRMHGFDASGRDPADPDIAG